MQQKTNEEIFADILISIESRFIEGMLINNFYATIKSDIFSIAEKEGLNIGIIKRSIMTFLADNL